ncbi:hypothetical protein K439DRAFT_978169 [Ramaria rubella]|nr:hypothetical protein K439DRAFT_978169 [Ramaria rubella]
MSGPKQKVICLGLGRTGTKSLADALEVIGFGPSYHMTTIIRGGGKDLLTWNKIGDGKGTTEDVHMLCDGYGAVLDYPPAMYPSELYAAYPDAKFILTTRDPEKWEKSVKNTIMRIPEMMRNKPERSLLEERLVQWHEVYMHGKYHRGRLFTHTQQELLDHNERVKSIIPPEKLLIYEVGEGWDRLVEYLEVSKPSVPFPRVNDTAEFQARVGISAVSKEEKH